MQKFDSFCRNPPSPHRPSPRHQGILRDLREYPRGVESSPPGPPERGHHPLHADVRQQHPWGRQGPHHQDTGPHPAGARHQRPPEVDRVPPLDDGRHPRGGRGQVRRHHGPHRRGW